ncbi:MAG: IS4 family transposase [Lachnospiraceae bacterium]|nr:IS4 family transposase [Lachnospiraceae bacterium]
MIPSSVRSKFYATLMETKENLDSYVNNPGSDMTRNRCCNFLDTILAILCLSMNRTNTELFNYFGIKRHIHTKSAFTQQRQKFNVELFPSLLKAFNQKVPFTKTYEGFHLVAIDGSDINLPTDKKDKIYCVKQARSDSCYYQMHINVLFDICENRYISMIPQPRPEMNENKAFCTLLDGCTMPENTIFIADRGYATLNTMANLIERDRFFLIRCKGPSSSGSFLRYLVPSDEEFDRPITIGVTRSRKKMYLKHPDTTKVLGHNRTFDYIEPDDKTTVYNMSFRCVCVKLSEDTYEYLLTNLPKEKFSTNGLKALYWKRWAIETSFRSIKYALSLVYLHSVKRELIIQEVYAKLLLYNLTSLIHSYVQNSKELVEKCKNRNKEYKVSFDDAVPVVREFLKSKISNKKVKALLLMHLTVIDEKANHPRKMRSQTVKPLNNRA